MLPFPVVNRLAHFTSKIQSGQGHWANVHISLFCYGLVYILMVAPGIIMNLFLNAFYPLLTNQNSCPDCTL